MNGNDNDDNLVYLTAREHYIVHQLLIKIYPEEISLISAALFMCVSSNKERSKNKQYEWLKKKFSKIQSKKLKIKNPSKNKHWIFNLQLKQCKLIEKNNKILNGWYKGRVQNWNNIQMCPMCNNPFNNNSQKRFYCSKKCNPKYNMTEEQLLLNSKLSRKKWYDNNREMVDFKNKRMYYMRDYRKSV